MFEKFIKYFSVISLCTFLLSYAYLDGYYSEFKIPIINYITTSEIFYTLLPLFIVCTGSYYGFIQGFVWKDRPRQVVETNNNSVKKPKWYRKEWVSTFFPYFVSLIGGIGWMINTRHLKYRDAASINALCLVISAGGIVYATYYSKYLSGFISKYYFQIGCFVIVAGIIHNFGRDTAQVTKILGSKDHLKISCQGKTYISDDKMIFAGETQTALFLYRKIDSSTIIISRGKIDSLMIK